MRRLKGSGDRMSEENTLIPNPEERLRPQQGASLGKLGFLDSSKNTST